MGQSNPANKLGSHIDASFSRQPSVTIEMVVRYDVNAVMFGPPMSSLLRCLMFLHAVCALERQVPTMCPIQVHTHTHTCVNGCIWQGESIGTMSRRCWYHIRCVPACARSNVTPRITVHVAAQLSSRTAPEQQGSNAHHIVSMCRSATSRETQFPRHIGTEAWHPRTREQYTCPHSYVISRCEMLRYINKLLCAGACTLWLEGCWLQLHNIPSQPQPYDMPTRCSCRC